MDKETILNQFDEIEKKINRLIEVNNSLEAINADLKGKNEKLEQSLQELQVSESKNDEIKTLIRSKIDGLMKRLDGISESTNNLINVGE